MNLYWMRKKLIKDPHGLPYRSWRQKKMAPVQRWINALENNDDALCLALIDSGALEINGWMDDGKLDLYEPGRRQRDKRRTPLHLASLYGRIELVLELIQRGADIHAKTIFMLTPLHMAALAKSMPLVAMYMECGLDIDQNSSSRSTFVDEFGDGPSGPRPRDYLREDPDPEAWAAWKAEKLKKVADGQISDEQRPARPKIAM